MNNEMDNMEQLRLNAIWNDKKNVKMRNKTIKKLATWQ